MVILLDVPRDLNRVELSATQPAQMALKDMAQSAGEHAQREPLSVELFAFLRVRPAVTTMLLEL